MLKILAWLLSHPAATVSGSLFIVSEVLGMVSPGKVRSIAQLIQRGLWMLNDSFQK